MSGRSQAAAPHLFGTPPAVVGHRGAPVAAPENTPASFAAAAAAGATWVELDARVDGDGTVVVHHDPTLRDGTPLVHMTTGQCRSAGVWTLSEVLDGLPATLGVDLEIKNFPGEVDHDEDMGVVRACAEVLARTAGERPVIITSFNPLVIAACADLQLPQPTGLLTLHAGVAEGIEIAVELGCRAVCPHQDTPGLDAAGVAMAHGAGLAVLVWTVDDPGRAAWFAAAEVDAICTNDPALIHGRLLR